MNAGCIVQGCRESLAECLCSPCPKHDGFCEMCPLKAEQKFPPMRPPPADRKPRALLLEHEQARIGVVGALLVCVAFVILLVSSLFSGGRRA